MNPTFAAKVKYPECPLVHKVICYRLNRVEGTEIGDSRIKQKSEHYSTIMFGLGVNGQSTGFGAQRINRRKRNNLPPSQPNQSSIIQTRSNSERSPAANIYQPDTGRPSLTSSEGSRRRARNALNRLKGPFKPSGPYQQYTPELERVLEENIKHLQGATRDLGPAVEDGSNGNYEFFKTSS